jgi:protein-glutamine gamma-glutamyltransferase
MLNTLRTRAAALPRDARDTLFLLAVIAWVMMPHAANLPWWCGVLAAGVLVWRAVLALRNKPLPGKGWLIGLLVVTAAATFFTHRTLLGRDAGVTLIVVLLALKTLELRARRDAFVVFFLGFFTMLTNFFFSQSLPVAAAMLVGLLGLLTALVNAHLPVGKPPLAEAARTAAMMALLGAPIMAVLFVLFPRFAPLWGIPNDAMTGRSGLSSTMQVGTVAKLALDESIAFRVKFEGSAPPASTLYFRGPVLSSFDGREWREMLPRLGARYPLSFYTSPQLQVAGNPVKYEVTLQPHNRNWLLLMDVAQRPPQAPGFESVLTSELQWVANRLVTDLLRYRAESYTQFRSGPLNITAVLPEYSELPPGFNPRTVQLASQLRAQLGAGADNQAFIQAAMQLLRTGGYEYTLEPGVYGQNSADEFWFDRKQGFCEHIASAFVILMRAGNIPARIVTGYQGGELNSVDGFWTVRQSDAHAWTELWLAGRGWVRVDPTGAVSPGRTGSFQRLTPPSSVFTAAVATLDPTVAANMRAAWEALNNSWNQWVLNYTQSKQLDLLKDIGFSSPSWEDLAYVLLGIVVGVALVGAAWSYWERIQHDPWLRLLGRTRRRLRAAGLEVPATAPPRKIANLVTAKFGPDARGLSDWLLKLEALRYSRQRPGSLAALRQEFRQLTWPQ